MLMITKLTFIEHIMYLAPFLALEISYFTQLSGTYEEGTADINTCAMKNVEERC